MKFALLSDIHADHAPIDIFTLDLPHDLDLIIVAGDLHTNDVRRQIILRELGLYAETLFIPGNHDYWGPTPAKVPTAEITIKGIKVSAATLWTTMTQEQWVLYKLGMNDYRYMYASNGPWEYPNYMKAHDEQRKFLLESGADIIVSHHAPSWKSIAPQYHGDALNFAYVNEFDHIIQNLPYKPKFWFHGHVHNSFDYMIGDTRVVCHPRGYPHERNHLWYKAKVFEL
jgi:predicted phosphodiesterase